MSRIEGQPDIAWLGQLHDAAKFVFAFHRAPDVGMGTEAHAVGDGLAPDFVERVGEPLELIVAGAVRRPSTEIGFPMIAAARRQEVTGEAHHAGHQFRMALLTEPGKRTVAERGGAGRGRCSSRRRGSRRRAASRQIPDVNQRDPCLIEQPLEGERLVDVLPSLIRIGLEALKSVTFESAMIRGISVMSRMRPLDHSPQLEPVMP